MKNIAHYSAKLTTCLLALFLIIAILALHHRAYSHIAHIPGVWAGWFLSSIGYIFGASLAALMLLKLHSRWSMLLATVIAIAAASQFSSNVVNDDLKLVLSCMAISITIISAYSLGVMVLENRYIPIYFGLIMFFSLTTDVSSYIDSSLNNIIHFSILITLLWWLANHPFTKENVSSTQHTSEPINYLAIFKSKTTWLLTCICVLTSLWLYLWQDASPLTSWLHKMQNLNLPFWKVSALHLQSVATGAMFAALLASSLATCRKLAMIAHIIAAITIALLAISPSGDAIFNLRILMLAAMLIGFKLLTYVLCAEFFPKTKFVLAFAIITIAKLVITPLLVLTLQHVADGMLMQANNNVILSLIVPLCLITAAILASKLQPHPRPKSLRPIADELKLLYTGHESVGKIFWLWYIIGFYFLFSPISMQLYMIFFSNAHNNSAANIVIPALNVIYFVFLIYCLIRNSNNSAAYIWPIIALAFFALGLAEWGTALVHGIAHYSAIN